jgi:hypothetical protein
VTLTPVVAATAFDPTAGNPDSTTPRGSGIETGNPDIGMAIPTVIAGMPGPVRMLARLYGDYFARRRWRRPDTHDHLCVSNSCRER